jgi:hypothetical protein
MDKKKPIPAFFEPYPGATLEDVLKEEREMTRHVIIDRYTNIQLLPGYGHGDGAYSRKYGKVLNLLVEQSGNSIIVNITQESTLRKLRGYIDEYLERYKKQFLVKDS